MRWRNNYIYNTGTPELELADSHLPILPSPHRASRSKPSRVRVELGKYFYWNPHADNQVFRGHSANGIFARASHEDEASLSV